MLEQPVPVVDVVERIQPLLPSSTRSRYNPTAMVITMSMISVFQRSCSSMATHVAQLFPGLAGERLHQVQHRADHLRGVIEVLQDVLEDRHRLEHGRRDGERAVPHPSGDALDQQLRRRDGSSEKSRSTRSSSAERDSGRARPGTSSVGVSDRRSASAS